MLCPAPRCTSIWGRRQHLLNSCIVFKSWCLIKLPGSDWGRRSWAGRGRPGHKHIYPTSPQVDTSCSPTVALHMPACWSHQPGHLRMLTACLLLKLCPCLEHSSSRLSSSSTSFKRPNSNINISSTRPFPACQAWWIPSLSSHSTWSID